MKSVSSTLSWGLMDDDIMHLVHERNQKYEEKEFRRWRKWLLSLPRDLQSQPKNNFSVDIELQPLRWKLHRHLSKRHGEAT